MSGLMLGIIMLVNNFELLSSKIFILSPHAQGSSSPEKRAVKNTKQCDGCYHCVPTLAHDQLRLCADYFYGENGHKLFCGSCLTIAYTLVARVWHRGIYLQGNSLVLHSEKQKISVIPVVRCRPGMVWRSCGVVSAFSNHWY